MACLASVFPVSQTCDIKLETIAGKAGNFYSNSLKPKKCLKPRHCHLLSIKNKSAVKCVNANFLSLNKSKIIQVETIRNTKDLR